MKSGRKDGRKGGRKAGRKDGWEDGAKERQYGREEEIKDIETKQMTRLQLESPKFRCFYASLQYKQLSCFDVVSDVL